MKYQYLPDSGLPHYNIFFILLMQCLNLLLSILIGITFLPHIVIAISIIIASFCLISFLILGIVGIYINYKDKLYTSQFMDEVNEAYKNFKIDVSIVNFIYDHKEEQVKIKINPNCLIINNNKIEINHITPIEQVCYAQFIMEYLNQYKFLKPFYGDYIDENDNQLKNTVVLKATLI